MYVVYLVNGKFEKSDIGGNLVWGERDDIDVDA